MKKYVRDIGVNALGQNQNIVNLRALKGLPHHPDFAHFGRVGIDFIPPMNALIHLKTKPKTSATQVDKSTSLTPPDTFSWDNIENVKARFQCDQLPLDWYSRQPGDQGSCGDCYAWGAAGHFGDRWRVWSQTDVPTLSPTAIVSCAKPPNGNKCNGGTADAGYKVAMSQGLPSEDCVGYDWCDVNCSSGKAPKCPAGGFKCSDGDTYHASNQGRHAEAVVGTYNQDYGAIMTELFNNGPTMAGFSVMADFYGPMTKNNNPVLWSETGGVYMNGDSIYPYTYKGKPSWNQNVGAHMISVVGWGKVQIKGITGPSFSMPGGKKADSSYVYFWYIRNSWASDWNANNPMVQKVGQKGGYFCSAWAGKYTINGRSVDVNKEIGLDHPNSQNFGANWFYRPDVAFASACDTPQPFVPPDDDDDDDDTPQPFVPPDDDDDDDDDSSCTTDAECPNGQICKDGVCTCAPCPECPKCPACPVDTRSSWQKMVDSLRAVFGGRSSCDGACTWGDGQCISATTPDFCALVSSGKGRFDPTKKCTEILDSSSEKMTTAEPLAPCVFKDGNCIMTTKDNCVNNIKGSWYQNQKTCKAVRKLKGDQQDNNGKVVVVAAEVSTTPDWVAPLIYSLIGFVGLIIIIGIIVVIVHYSTTPKKNSTLSLPKYDSPTPLDLPAVSKVDPTSYSQFRDLRTPGL